MSAPKIDKVKLLQQLEDRYHSGMKLSLKKGKWYINVNTWSKPFVVTCNEGFAVDRHALMCFEVVDGHFVEVPMFGKLFDDEYLFRW